MKSERDDRQRIVVIAFKMAVIFAAPEFATLVGARAIRIIVARGDYHGTLA